MATAIVTTTVETSPPTGKVSLGQAIQSGDSLIQFNLDPLTDPGFNKATGTFTISLTTALPTIDHQVTIDGTSQKGYTNAPLIELDGGGNSFDGLTLGAGSDRSQILPLDITHFNGSAISIQSTGNTISGDFLGTDISQTIAQPGNQIGVLINNASNNSIGLALTSPSGKVVSSNVIGKNTSAGVSITGATATANLVAGNFIGTDSTGQSLGNVDGVDIAIGDNTVNANNTIGGTAAGAGNTIANNTGDAVHIVSGKGNSIRQNLIFGNPGAAIVVDPGANSGQHAPAGLAVASAPNLTTIDFQITNSGSASGDFTVEFFATNNAGTVGPASQFLGSVTEKSVPVGTHGFTATLNLASKLQSPLSVTATVTAPDNSTSTFATQAAQPAAEFTVTNVTDNVPGSEVGSLRQVILNANNDPPAANQTDHIIFAIPSSPRVINVASALPAIAVPVFVDGTSQTGFTNQPIVEIKGSGGSFDGLILGPGSVGSKVQALDVANFAAGVHVESANVSILGNFVGTDLTGKAAGPGNVVGILLDDASAVTVGGTTSGTGNTIGFNSAAGVQISGASATDSRADVIEGNFIGTDLNDDPLGNGAAVQVLNAANNLIGGVAASGAANTIGFNTNNGIAILAGNGNAIRQNSYTNSNGNLTSPSLAANDIGIASGANSGIQPPTLLSVSLAGSVLSLSFTEAVTPVTLDIYKLTAAARIFLGTANGINGNASITTSKVALGDSIIATATGTNEGTSAFSAPVTIATATTVTTTVDNGNDASPTVGSLRAAIETANNNANSKISFAIPGSNEPFVINLASPLPNIMKPTTIDGTTQDPASPVPVIEINGSAVTGSGLVLSTGSDGSVIKGLDIVNFAGAGIDVETSGNTIQTDYIGILTDGKTAAPNNQGILINGSGNLIGGTTTALGNTIADNSHAAVNVNNGNGNSIRENLVFGNGQGIVLNAGNNANHNQPAPVINSVASVPGTTTVTVNLTGVPAGTVLDFFASAPGDALGTQVQAHIFLGTHTVTAGDSGIVTFAGTTLASNQQVTATATSTTGDTSPFAAPVSVPIPFLVTTTAVSGTGSLAAAIAGANNDTTNPNADTIAFQIPKTDSNYDSSTNTWTITITSGNLLQPITRPVILDATTQPGFSGAPVIEINGGALNADGLVLGTNSTLQTTSSGSTIKGFDIVNFAGAGINIETTGNIVQTNILGVPIDGKSAAGNADGVLITGSSNTIGGTASGAGNVIESNTANGVEVSSGNGNSIRQNSIFNNDGLAIKLNAGAPVNANRNQGTPIIQGVSTLAGKTSIQFQLANQSPFSFTAGVPYTIEFFASSAASQAQKFLGSTQVTPSAIPASFTAQLSLSLAVGQFVTATATSANTSDTSEVAVGQTVASPFVVTTTADNGNNTSPIVGSLRQVINAVNASPPVPGTTDPITFQIPKSDPNFDAATQTWTISLGVALPTITVPVTLDATSQGTFTGTPFVELEGGGHTFDGLVLDVHSDGSTVKGLDVTDFVGAGIHVKSGNDLIINNDIGPDLSGKLTNPTNTVGVLIDNTAGNTIGGSTATSNIIGFSTSAGVSIAGTSAGGNVVASNFIGSNPATPTAAMDNHVGVVINDAGNNTIGGSAATANVIGFNTSSGVSITGVSATGNLVAFNFIGTDAAADKMANGTGVVIDGGATNNVIGGSTSAANIIGANTAAGVSISGSTSTLNQIAGNFIGTNSGGVNLGNGEGVVIENAPSNTIGGSTASAANIIGFNHVAGVSISGAAATNNLVAANLIGVSGLGVVLGNGAGVIIDGNAGNNTIGGSLAGFANTIAHNSGDAVHVISGSGNAIRQNLIFSNASPDIVVDAGANSGQQPPSKLAVTSVPNLTTIDFQITNSTSASGAFTLDFFASDNSGTVGPASQFLGSATEMGVPVGTHGFTATLTLATPLTSSQTLTATVTAPDNSTSQFAATAAEPVSPLQVTNTTDQVPGSEVGSLRQAILNANSNPPASGFTDLITFNVPTNDPHFNPTTGAWTISILSTPAQPMPLPTITVPVSIQGLTTATGVPRIIIDPVAGDGLTLGTGSDGSKISGLDLVDFSGAGINIQSNNDIVSGNLLGTDLTGLAAGPGNGIGVLIVGGNGNTIGGVTAGAGNTIGFNTVNGISVLSGTGDSIRQNLYTGSGGASTPIEANDIALGPNANNNQAPPTLTSASLQNGDLRVLVSNHVTNASTIVEFYRVGPAVGSTPPERTFLNSATVLATDPATTQVEVPVFGLSVGDTIVATATVVANGTSAFSAETKVANQFEVTNTNDSGFGSLRQAIQNVNLDSGDSQSSPDIIIFQIPIPDGGGGYDPTTGIWTITPTTPLDTIVRPVIIDATTQFGYYAFASLNPSLPQEPLVQVVGTSLTAGDGLVLGAGTDNRTGQPTSSAGSSIFGLSIFGFQNGAGIHIETDDDTIAADWIGVGSGSNLPGNSIGVQVDGASSNTIGLATITVNPPQNSDVSPPPSPVQVNALSVISGNTKQGILIENSTSNPAILSQKNLVQHTFVGTDVNGQIAIGNGVGVEILNSSLNTIGGTASATLASNLNLISGNKGDGVEVEGSSASNTIVNAIIGPDISGSNTKFPLNNNGDGILIHDAQDTQVGFVGTNQIWGNTISGNVGDGVEISGSAQGTVLEHNLIGTDSTGTFTSDTLGNHEFGIAISAQVSSPPVGSTIGGPSASFANVVSGNSEGGISIQNSQDSMILGNYIGTDFSGTLKLGNGIAGDGIDLSNASNNTIGGTMGSGSVLGAGNVISGNVGSGISVTNSSSDSIFGNRIGTDLTGTLPLGNGTGIVLSQSTQIVIGAFPSEGNLIAANLADGVDITGGGNNTLVANTIGATTASLGNAANGVHITDSTSNTVGAAAVTNPLTGAIGDLGNGANIITGNLNDGVRIDISSANTLTDVNNIVMGNLISRNSLNGVHVVADLGGGAQIAQITDNFIGTDSTGLTTYDKNNQNQSLGNGKSGILLETTAAARGTLNSVTTSGNVLSGNGLSGITVDSVSGGLWAKIVVQDNLIGTDKNGANTGNSTRAPFGNVLDGIQLDGVSGALVGNPSPVVGAVSLDLASSLGNLISGNLGRGVELDAGASSDLINSNLIGVVLAVTSTSPLQLIVRADDSNGNNAGNLSDGIFVLDSSGNTIQGNEVSANRGYGIHETGGVGSLSAPNLKIIGNFIGTNNDGTKVLDDQSNNFGNGADGVFLDSVSGVIIGGTSAVNPVLDRNVISGNHANGIDLLSSSIVLISNNRIGTDVNGNSTFGDPTKDFGNAANGIFINQSTATSLANGITIGGTTIPDRNFISGNHASGIYVSRYDARSQDDGGSCAV